MVDVEAIFHDDFSQLDISNDNDDDDNEDDDNEENYNVLEDSNHKGKGKLGEDSEEAAEATFANIVSLLGDNFGAWYKKQPRSNYCCWWFFFRFFGFDIFLKENRGENKSELKYHQFLVNFFDNSRVNKDTAAIGSAKHDFIVFLYQIIDMKETIGRSNGNPPFTPVNILEQASESMRKFLLNFACLCTTRKISLEKLSEIWEILTSLHQRGINVREFHMYSSTNYLSIIRTLTVFDSYGRCLCNSDDSDGSVLTEEVEELLSVFAAVDEETEQALKMLVEPLVFFIRVYSFICNDRDNFTISEPRYTILFLYLLQFSITCISLDSDDTGFPSMDSRTALFLFFNTVCSGGYVSAILAIFKRILPYPVRYKIFHHIIDRRRDWNNKIHEFGDDKVNAWVVVRITISLFLLVPVSYFNVEGFKTVIENINSRVREKLSDDHSHFCLYGSKTSKECYAQYGKPAIKHYALGVIQQSFDRNCVWEESDEFVLHTINANIDGLAKGIESNSSAFTIFLDIPEKFCECAEESFKIVRKKLGK